MREFDRNYLELLAEKYPSEAAACSELINLSSILALPKGTEHFISDLHGEYGAVSHILNNCSGVILEKVLHLFKDEIGEAQCHALCSIIYYPQEELALIKQRGSMNDDVLRQIIEHLRALMEMLSSKYTRSYVRRHMPPEWAFVLDELLHTQQDEDGNQYRYHDAIVDSIIDSGAAESLIAAMATLIKRLAVDKLHVVGDIFDRGPDPASIIERLMEQPNIDIQWGNHDILWLGAGAGCPASIVSVLRISVDYHNEATLERDYGISLRQLTDFCAKVYGDAQQQTLHQALSVLLSKLEGRIIKRHPGYGMDSRLMLDKVNWDNYTVTLASGVYPLKNTHFPTVDSRNPYALTEDEQALIEEYADLFRNSKTLHRHLDFIYHHGSTYLVSNGNLLFHGCIPMTADGQFAKVRHGGQWYSGRELLDYADNVVRAAWVHHDKSAFDMMWYLWCGIDSPFSGRQFHTFERCYIEDKSTWDEPKNPYFKHWEDEKMVSMILSEFGLDPVQGRIINGHTPVKARMGESPIKANGKLFIIDGGFCQAYQGTTGIAGYTLIYNSHGMRLKSHRPFEGVSKVLSENADIESSSIPVETFPLRRYIADTDSGARLEERRAALKALISAYRDGSLQQH
jgi:fructose-1,6-bisphosphatase-3